MLKRIKSNRIILEVRLLSFLKKAFNFILDLLILGFSAFIASLAFPSKYIENGVPFLAFFYLIPVFYVIWRSKWSPSLNVPLDRMLAVVNDIDCWYVDIKDMNPDIYLRYTGKPNAQVLANLAELIRLVPAERICVRVPLIKGYNSPVDVERSVNSLSEMGFQTTVENVPVRIFRTLSLPPLPGSPFRLPARLSLHFLSPTFQIYI